MPQRGELRYGETGEFEGGVGEWRGGGNVKAIRLIFAKMKA